MGETESTYCEGNGVVFLEAIGASPPDGVDIIWGITSGDVSGTPTVKFKVNNPFDEKADIYVSYHEKEGELGASDGECVGEMKVPGCSPNASEIEAACLTPSGSGLSFSIVSVYFVTDDSYVGTGGAAVDECCHEDPDTIAASTPVVEYTYEIHCECPMTNARQLRGSALFN
jgi:hypothetical protein